MKPVQPYFALASEKYYKRKLGSGDIAHIYEYHADSISSDYIFAVPDGCIDIFIDEDDPDLKAYVAGTVLDGSPTPLEKGHKYFGIRFMPGVVPAFIDGTLKDFIDNTFDLSLCSKFSNIIQDGIFSCGGFRDKANFIQNFYHQTLINKALDHFSARLSIVKEIQKISDSSEGTIQIKDIVEKTGYTERYIDKVFKDETGLTPKTYCKIVRFQNTIQHINFDNDITLTDLITEHGYYDQSQFIHEFKKLSGQSPLKYRHSIIESRYASKFILE